VLEFRSHTCSVLSVILLLYLGMRVPVPWSALEEFASQLRVASDMPRPNECRAIWGTARVYFAVTEETCSHVPVACISRLCKDQSVRGLGHLSCTHLRATMMPIILTALKTSGVVAAVIFWCEAAGESKSTEERCVPGSKALR
jgi:hypothetical protein